MNREFVRTRTFERHWANIGLNDEDFSKLERILSENTQAGDVIPGLSGGRKLRFALEGRGKSGGARVIYVDVVVREQIYLLAAYPKNAQADLTTEQKRTLSKFIIALKED